MNLSKITYLRNNKYLILPLFFAIFLVLPKWFFSIMIFPVEDLLLKIIHETGDIHYYPLINNLSDLNLSPLYNENDNSNFQFSGIFSFPILNFIIPSIFWKIFGPISFIILEFLCVYLFFKIFQSLIINYTNNIYIITFFPLLLFSLTFYIRILGTFDYQFVKLIEANFTSFYNLRFPRPLISNLFLFYYIYLCHEIFILDKNKKKIYLLLGLVSGLSLHSFYYFFIIQNIFLVLFFIYKYQKNLIQNIIRYKKLLFLYFSVILIFLILYLLNISFADSDYSSRMGIVKLNIAKKIILLDYYFGFIKNPLFIIIFLFNAVIFFSSKKIFKFLIILFISTILSPLFFFIVSNQAIDIYHFFNFILISGTINIIIFSLYLINLFINKKVLNVSSVFFIFISLFSINYYLISEDVLKSNFDYRADINKTINKIENLKLENKKILVTDLKISAWLLMNDYKNFSYISTNVWTTRSNKNLQDDFIKVIKFFRYDIDDYNSILQNRIYGQRMYNHIAISFLGRKYLANKLSTFNESDDFKDIKFIKNIKPSISHSFAIPKFEIINLVNNFDKVDTKLNPEILILDKNDDFFDITKVNLSNYCLFDENDNFAIYLTEKIC